MQSIQEALMESNTCTSLGTSPMNTNGTESLVNTSTTIRSPPNVRNAKRPRETATDCELMSDEELKKVRSKALEELKEELKNTSDSYQKILLQLRYDEYERFDLQSWQPENIAKKMKEEDELEHSCSTPPPEPSKVNTAEEKINLKKRLMRYCVENKITNQMLLHKRPYDETEDFFLHPQYNSVIGTIFNVVSGQLAYEPFKPFIHHKKLKEEGGVLQDKGKVHKFLSEVQRWDREKIKRFAKVMVQVLNRRSGKKNTVWLQGVSNAGKSQLINSLMQSYFPNTIGTPNNSVRTTFTFNDCMYKRVILWEEPNITVDNIEDTKIILGGQDCRIDAKYQSSAVLQSTPFVITSNKDLWAMCTNHRQELLNRVYWFKLNSVCPPNNEFPFRKYDWDIFFTNYFDDIKYDIGK